MFKVYHCPRNSGETMNRREARELVMKCIFQMEVQKEFTRENAEKFLKDKITKQQNSYISNVLEQFCSNIEAIDDVLNQNSKGWPVSRMAKADLAIARLAVCEILYIDDVPKAVAINEAVDIAKIYGSEQSPKFINAILKNI